MSLDKLKALLSNMQTNLTREQKRERASLRNAAETARRCEVFHAVKRINQQRPMRKAA